MDDNKNEKTESKSQYRLDNDNFTRTIIYSIIIIGIAIVHSIFATLVSGNLFWFIFNVISTAGEVVVGVLGLKFLLNTVEKNKDKDIATFVVLIVALVFAACFAIWYLKDASVNFIGLLRQ